MDEYRRGLCVDLDEENPKKIFIDVYTDWCGWCKRMDKATFQNEEVAAYMNEHYYNVKFDAEQKESIEMLGNTFEFVPQGSRGYHELAAALLNGKMSYPTVVFMNGKFEMLSPVPGYQEPAAFMNVAKYFGDNIYKKPAGKTTHSNKKSPARAGLFLRI
jgi:thioredoxin-related protein